MQIKIQNSFIDSIFRGIGQVIFQNNTYAGIIFLAGIFYNSQVLGLSALLGCVVSTTTASLLRADPAQIKSGLFGFNGTLTAIGLMLFLKPSPLLVGYVIIASAASTILMAAMMRSFQSLKLPTLTAPFVFTTLCFLLASSQFEGIPKATHLESSLSATTFLEGILQGAAQIFFQENVVTGILIFIGLLVSSRRCFAMGLIGSTLGAATSLLLGESEQAIRSGAFGFNAVLTAIALGSVFLDQSRMSFAFATLGTIVTTIAFVAISEAFRPIGMPAMTLPFVLVTWIFILADSHFQPA